MNRWTKGLVALVAVALAAIGIAAGSRTRTINGSRVAADEASVATVTEIYVVALTGQPAPVHLANPIYVYNWTCPVPPGAGSLPCSYEPIPTRVQDAVSDALGGQARFLARPREVAEPGPTVYSFGALTVVGDHATIELQSQCGPLCGSGETLSLARADGVWIVTHRVTRWLN